MFLDDYQTKAMSTAVYKQTVPTDLHLPYAILGLAGEAGELANKEKKILRDDNGDVTPEARRLLMKELGGVLWYCAAVAYEIGLSLSEVAQYNINELASRKERGTLQGSGDDR